MVAGEKVSASHCIDSEVAMDAQCRQSAGVQTLAILELQYLRRQIEMMLHGIQTRATSRAWTCVSPKKVHCQFSAGGDWSSKSRQHSIRAADMASNLLMHSSSFSETFSDDFAVASLNPIYREKSCS